MRHGHRCNTAKMRNRVEDESSCHHYRHRVPNFRSTKRFRCVIFAISTKQELSDQNISKIIYHLMMNSIVQ